MQAASLKEGHSVPQWREHSSRHFAFRFLPDSPAEKNATGVASRLETFRDALVAALNLGDVPQRPLQVWLSDLLGDEQDSDQTAGDDRSYVLGPGLIRAVYCFDAPGEGLERAVTESLLTSALDGAAVPASLLDGIVGYVFQQIASPDGDVNAALMQRLSAGQEINLTDALTGRRTTPKPLYHQIVTSFVTYLLTTYGPERLAQFGRRFDPAAPDQAAEAAYSRPMRALEAGWLASLRERPSPGMTAFLRQSFVYLRPYWPQQILIALALVITTGFTIILPLGFRYLIDNAITPGDTRNLVLIVGALLVLFAVQAIAGLGRDYLSARVGADVLRDIRLKMFTHLQRLSMHFYSQAQVGDIMSRFSSDLTVLEFALTRMLPMGISLVIGLVSSVIILFGLEWRLALLTLLGLPLFFVGPVLFGGRAARLSYELQQQEGSLASSLQENIGAQTVVWAFTLQALLLTRFREQVARVARSATSSNFLASIMAASGQLSMSLIQVLAIGVGALFVISGDLTLGALVAFQGLLSNVTAPLFQVSQIMQMLQQASGGLQRINELLEVEPKIVDSPNAVRLSRFSREIHFDNVSFSYTGEQVNLRHVNLTIHAGQSVSFVGPSGCGKSTMLKLLMRFYDATSGAVTMDGHDLRDVTQESLAGQMGAVFQDTVLFNTSVRENIRLGKLDASDEQIAAAAEAAEISDLITALPEGYDTVVGERGGRLSGGQRQRIAIARAILRDPAILVLDEATSALDPQTEATINTTLAKLAKGRTVLSVTHRLSSVVGADNIVVLDHGEVIEQGTHAALLEKRGLYHRLWEQQTGFERAAGTQHIAIEAARLQAVPFFKNLDGVLLAALANGFITQRFAEGETIFEEGARGDQFYVIVRGHVEVVTTGPLGQERRLAVLRDGDYFGEMALLRDAPRTATVRARAPTVTLSLEREQFLELLERVPDLRSAFERVVEVRRAANLATTG